MMYTIVFHDGTVQHVTPAQRDVIIQEVEKGRKHIMVDDCLLMLSSIARIDPSEKWLDAENERIAASDYYICDYGTKHSHECVCAKYRLLPLTRKTAVQLTKYHLWLRSASESEIAEFRTYRYDDYKQYYSATTDEAYISRVAERLPKELKQSFEQKLLEKPKQEE